MTIKRLEHPATSENTDQENVVRKHDHKRKATDHGSIQFVDLTDNETTNLIAQASGIKSGSKSSDRAPTKKQKIDTSGKTKASNTKSVDISNIRLDYEDDDDVPVFDTPEVIRQKISDHLREKDVTQASFLRDIWAELKGPRKTSRVFQSKQLKDFCSYTESAQGNRTAIFYAAYVYFEKLRIAEGKEKTNFRLGMEALWPCGFDTERDLGRAWCPAGTVPYTDDYGITRTRPESDAE